AAFAPSKERHLETTAQGAAFIAATKAAWPCDALDRLAAAWDGPVAYPVAVGVTAAGHGIALEAALHAYLHAVTANLISAGGPVGSGKTALMDALCKRLRDRFEIAAITNDIYTKWDAEYLVRSGALAPERIAGVETGGCPHTAIREDASINLAAVAEMRKKFPDLDLVLIESGGDNLAATFSPELADLTIYVIHVPAGDKIPS